MPAGEDLVVRIAEDADTAVRVVGDQVLDIAGVSDGSFVVVTGGLLVPRHLVDADIPSTIARDSEVTSAVAAEATARASAVTAEASARAAADALLLPKAWDVVFKATGDTPSTDATTFLNVPGITFAVGAGEVWAYEIVYIYDGSTTGDIALRQTDITGHSMTRTAMGIATNATVMPAAVQEQVNSALTTSFTFGAVGVGTKCMIVERGILTTPNAGTMQARFRQNGLDGANATTVFADTYGRARRIS